MLLEIQSNSIVGTVTTILKWEGKKLKNIENLCLDRIDGVLYNKCMGMRGLRHEVIPAISPVRLSGGLVKHLT